MVEIAISLAIIGIALVAIIGVLPLGMKIQRANREATLINQDATVLLEAIRGGARGSDDLTNYVFGITNTGGGYPGQPRYFSGFTNGAQIVGLLSTPEFVDSNASPVPYPGYVTPTYTNRMVAFVYSMNGPAVEKPPQLANSLVRQSSFSYGLVCQNSAVPTAVDTNGFSSTYSLQLAANLHELRLYFEWPLLPDSQPPGKVHYGPGQQTYRASVAGQLALDTNSVPGVNLYFFHSQTFTNAP